MMTGPFRGGEKHILLSCISTYLLRPYYAAGGATVTAAAEAAAEVICMLCTRKQIFQKFEGTKDFLAFSCDLKLQIIRSGSEQIVLEKE